MVRANQGSWSWKPYTYRKKQVCDSEPRFIRPGYAQDSTGKWQVIVQTDAMPQRVAIDLCRTPGQPCKYEYTVSRVFFFNADLIQPQSPILLNYYKLFY